MLLWVVWSMIQTGKSHYLNQWVASVLTDLGHRINNSEKFCYFVVMNIINQCQGP